MEGKVKTVSKMNIKFAKFHWLSVIVISVIMARRSCLAQAIVLDIDWNTMVRLVPDFAYGVNSPANFIPSYSNNDIFMEHLRTITQKKGIIRLHGWGMIDESSPESWLSNGEWNATKIQQALTPLIQRGYEVMINIPSGPMGEDDYQNPQQFAQFCAELVQIVNIENSLDVTYWELPNERESDFISPGLSASEMASFIQTVSQSMKAVDPTIKVGGPGTAWVNTGYLTQLVQLAASDLDFVTCHTYAGDCTNSLTEIYNNAQDAIADLAVLRENLNGITAPDYLPIFLTEYNLSYQGCADIQTYKGAVYDAIIMTQSIKSGIDASCYWNVAPYSDMSIIVDSDLDENAYLYKKMNSLFQGEMVQSTTSNNAKVLIFATKNPIANHYSFCLINRTSTSQDISLQMNGLLPEVLYRSLWDSNNSYLVDTTTWAELNNGVFSLSPYSVTIFNGIISTPMPVVYASPFTAFPEAKGILLTWETSMEEQADYFFVEKYEDGHFVKYQALDAGGHVYRLWDLHPSNGINLYRLGEFDFDGEVSYSPVVSAFWQEALVPQLFPNPTRGVSTFHDGQSHRVIVTDSAGRIVFAGRTDMIRIERPGVYYVRFPDLGVTRTWVVGL